MTQLITQPASPPALKSANTVLFVADMAGTLVFAIEGGIAAIVGNLDLLGLLVLAFATALGGGIVRDLLIGDTPPASLRNPSYAATAFLGGLTVFLLHHHLDELPVSTLMVLDAAGLSLFAIAGTEKALQFQMHPFIAVLLGTITGVGGGTVRDIFLARIPVVLRADVYATAALAGAVCMIAARKLRFSPTVAALLGGLVCFSLRVISVWRHWNLPRVGPK